MSVLDRWEDVYGMFVSLPLSYDRALLIDCIAGTKENVNLVQLCICLCRFFVWWLASPPSAALQFFRGVSCCEFLDEVDRLGSDCFWLMPSVMTVSDAAVVC